MPVLEGEAALKMPAGPSRGRPAKRPKREPAESPRPLEASGSADLTARHRARALVLRTKKPPPRGMAALQAASVGDGMGRTYEREFAKVKGFRIEMGETPRSEGEWDQVLSLNMGRLYFEGEPGQSRIPRPVGCGTCRISSVLRG